MPQAVRRARAAAPAGTRALNRPRVRRAPAGRRAIMMKAQNPGRRHRGPGGCHTVTVTVNRDGDPGIFISTVLMMITVTAPAAMTTPASA